MVTETIFNDTPPRLHEYSSQVHKNIEEALTKLTTAITVARPKEPTDQQSVVTPQRGWSLPPSVTDAPLGIKPWAVPRLRLEPPRFDGENAPDWIRKIQKYYNHHYTPLDDRLYLTQYLFDHPASDWREYWVETNKGKSWDDFLLAVEQRFDPEFYKPYAATASPGLFMGTGWTGRDQRKPNRTTANPIANREPDHQPPQRKNEVTQEGARVGDDIVTLVPFESEQQTASFAVTEIKDVDSFSCVDGSESNISLAYLGVDVAMQLQNCEDGNGNLKEEVRHTQEISGDAAALRRHFTPSSNEFMDPDVPSNDVIPDDGVALFIATGQQPITRHRLTAIADDGRSIPPRDKATNLKQVSMDMQLTSFVGGEKALASKIPFNPISRTPQNTSSTHTRGPLSQLHGEEETVQLTGLSLNLGCRSRIYAIMSISTIASSLSEEDERGLPSTWDPGDLVGNSCSVTISETNMDGESDHYHIIKYFAIKKYWDCSNSWESTPKFHSVVQKVQLSSFKLSITGFESAPTHGTRMTPLAGENHLSPLLGQANWRDSTELPGATESLSDNQIKKEVFRSSIRGMESGRRKCWRDEQRDVNSSVPKDRCREGEGELPGNRRVDRWADSSGKQYGAVRRTSIERWADPSNKEGDTLLMNLHAHSRFSAPPQPGSLPPMRRVHSCESLLGGFMKFVSYEKITSRWDFGVTCLAAVHLVMSQNTCAVKEHCLWKHIFALDLPLIEVALCGFVHQDTNSLPIFEYDKALLLLVIFARSKCIRDCYAVWKQIRMGLCYDGFVGSSFFKGYTSGDQGRTTPKVLVCLIKYPRETWLTPYMPP